MTKFKLSKKIAISILAVCGSALILLATLFFLDFIRATQQGEKMPSEAVIASATEVSERDPGPVDDDYTVGYDQPRRIDIPSINVSAYVQRVGVLNNGEMATPNNIFFTGWYVDSVAPGEAGLSIINGHAGGRYNHGVFRKLINLVRDDSIRVQMGDLSWREFTVLSVESYTVSDAGKALHKAPTESRELRLITCDGVYDNEHRTYDRRVIVEAKRSD